MANAKKLLLIVEDEEIVARVYQAGLAKSSFEVQIARDGVEALEMMKKNIPNLVLLDFMMPRMNGIQVLEAMQKDSKLKGVKVIMMSNLSGAEDMELAKSKGAKDYWIKRDIQPNELERRVNEIFDGRGK